MYMYYTSAIHCMCYNCLSSSTMPEVIDYESVLRSNC